MKFNNTSEIKVPKKIVDRVIGQDNVIKIIKKAAKQRRHVLLIGQSGTGKSMCGQALAELLPNEKLLDILSFDNPSDENTPIIKTFPQGEGKKLIQKSKLQAMSSLKNQNFLFFILLVIAMITPWWIRSTYGDIMAAASLIGSMIFFASFVLFINISRRTSLIGGNQTKVPKLLVDNSDKKQSPFIDGSGAQIDALLGNILHDPLQCHFSVTNIDVVNQSRNNLLQIEEKKISSEIDKLLVKHKQNIIKQKDYLATYLDKNELMILGEKDSQVEPVKILSINKHLNKHPYLIKIITETGKTLTITPEHKIAIKKLGKIIYKEAKDLTKFDKVITKV